jgi:hypothetical protein
MSQTDAYRTNAHQCFGVAEQCQETGRRMRLLNMALVWMRLAEQAEKNDKTDVVYETPVG